MVANYTIGNPKYKESEKDAADIMVKAQQFNAELYDLIDKDAAVYEKLSSRMKELKNDRESLEHALREALYPPFEVCKISAECLKLCRKLVDCGNRNLISDIAVAAVMLEAAFFAAKYNVYANLKSIRDLKFIEDVHSVLAPLEDAMPKLKEDILESCEDVISK